MHLAVRRISVVVAFLTFSTWGALAQHINYQAIFELHNDKVSTRNSDDRTTRVLQLGSVTLTEITKAGEVTYIGLDASEYGAVGCVARILLDFVNFVQQCDGLATPSEIETLESRLSKVQRFVSRNTYPPVELEEIEVATRHWLEEQDDIIPQICRYELDEDYLAMFDAIVGKDFGEELDKSLAIDRLPVTNPCL